MSKEFPGGAFLPMGLLSSTTLSFEETCQKEPLRDLRSMKHLDFTLVPARPDFRWIPILEYGLALQRSQTLYSV
jgi:hypothetical protein